MVMGQSKKEGVMLSSKGVDKDERSAREEVADCKGMLVGSSAEGGVGNERVRFSTLIEPVLF